MGAQHEARFGNGGSPPSAVDHLDSRLAKLSRADAALRLRLGQVLEVLHRRAQHFALGFSSSSAYALERCGRSVRWVEGARCLARRLEALPALRVALARGELSWSVAELVARIARPANEAEWMATAERCTVRELRELVCAARREDLGARAGIDGSAGMPDLGEEHGTEETCTLTVTVDREDAWLFEATRSLLEQLGAHGAEAQIEALLAEAQETLLAQLPLGSIDHDVCDQADVAVQRWREQLREWREESERRCEAHFRTTPRAAPSIDDVSAGAAAGCSSLEGLAAHELDATVRDLSRGIAAHELVLSRCILAFHRIDGWRRLGYATDSQYARERLGMSRSSIMARRALAARLEALPVVTAALAGAQIGVEAALQLVRIATPRTEEAWVAHAQCRTVKHLREEVAAARSAVRLSGEADCPPPEEAELDAYAELERAVLSGSLCERSPRAPARPLSLEADESVERRAWHRMLASLATFVSSGGIQMSAGAPRAHASAGRVELRWRVPRGTYQWWHRLEGQARRWLRGMSWLRFLCLTVWHAWRHLLGAHGEYGRIYLRDGYRCRSPVCTRQDVTPHHLRFRSQGGGDEASNLASVCSWCHLFGIHGGRIRAEGTADHIRWELGPLGNPCVVVEGRTRIEA